MTSVTHTLIGKTALVTGASRGIGRAVAIALAQAGAHVIGTATTMAGAERINQILNEPSVGKGTGVMLNVDQHEAAQALIEHLVEQQGSLDILVNNAGITRDNLAVRLKDEDWLAVIETNLSAVFRLSRAVLKPMMKQRWGRIINITSVVGATGNPGQSNYAAAKAGVVGMSKALAREVGSRGVTVNCVAPGFIDTDMTRALSEEQTHALLGQIPLRRLGKPEDIAHAVVFLASPQADYITGATLHINGGMHM